MRQHVVYRGIAPLFILVALVLSACSTRPLPDAFDPTTTTATGIGVVEAVTTSPQTLPPPENRVSGLVVSVTDGDTVSVRIDGTEREVRLLGINAPESSECWGPEATALLSGMILGEVVVLGAGLEDIDAFGRLLRYIYLENLDGPIFVNAEMVRAGNAVGLQNGHEFDREFKSQESRAFQSGRGMWGTFICGDEEGISADRPVIRVAEIEYDPRGPDNEVLNEEWVTIVNQGYGTVSLSGWVIRDESSRHRLTLPSGTVLAPGGYVTVVTGCEGGPAGAVYWCSDSAIWSNQGDTIIVSDTLGNAVIWHTYAGT